MQNILSVKQKLFNQKGIPQMHRCAYEAAPGRTYAYVRIYKIKKLNLKFFKIYVIINYKVKKKFKKV